MLPIVIICARCLLHPLCVKRMHEHYRIKEILWPMLKKAGFNIESENPELDDYGSVRTVFVSGKKSILLEWDGEEGLGYVEVWKKEEWERLSTNILESKESEFNKAIENLCEEVKEYL